MRIVVSETSNNPQATAALKHHYSALIHAGAQIWEYPGAVVHAKLVVADDTVVFGTVNLDAWALYRNYEIAMMARSAAAATLFEERVFGPDIARSHPGTPPTGPRRPVQATGSGTSSPTSSSSFDRVAGAAARAERAERSRPQQPASTTDAAIVSQTPQPELPADDGAVAHDVRGRPWTSITAAEPSTVTMPSHEPRASAPTPASAISAKMITSHPLCGPSNPSSDTGPALRHVPNTPTIAKTTASRQMVDTPRSAHASPSTRFSSRRTIRNPSAESRIAPPAA